MSNRLLPGHVCGVSGTILVVGEMQSGECAGSRHRLNLPCATPASKIAQIFNHSSNTLAGFLSGTGGSSGTAEEEKKGGNLGLCCFPSTF